MNRIRECRKSAGFTQQELADAVGVHFGIVSDWELNKKKPRPSKKVSLSKVLGADISVLFPDDNTHRAIHYGVINVLDRSIECAVLENEDRVLTSSGIFSALGRTPRGQRTPVINGMIKTPEFMDANNLKPFISDDLRQLIKPLEFLDETGRKFTGYKAEILPLICDLYLEARAAGQLTKKQMPLAQSSEILMRSFAKLGIIALIDEATGYQKKRERDALQQILEKFIAKELQPWLKTFPDEYYEEMFRLKNWQTPIGKNRPGVVGKYTNNLIYDRLAPGVKAELQRLNPKNDNGNRSSRHHQLLTQETGHPKLKEHISNVITLMRISDNWDGFMSHADKAFPIY